MRRRFLSFTTGNFTFLSRGEGIFNAHKARGLSANVALLRGAVAVAARSFSNPVSTTTLFPKKLCKRASAHARCSPLSFFSSDAFCINAARRVISTEDIKVSP